MATIEEIRQELNDAKEEYKKAVEELKKFEGENKQKRLVGLEEKLDNGEYRNKEQKERWEGWIDELKEEKKRLVKDKDDWKEQVVKLQDALMAFGGEGKGNKQIA